jgi:hypothetical protein
MIRTCDLLIRSQLLYPAELRNHYQYYTSSQMKKQVVSVSRDNLQTPMDHAARANVPNDASLSFASTFRLWSPYDLTESCRNLIHPRKWWRWGDSHSRPRNLCFVSQRPRQTLFIIVNYITKIKPSSQYIFFLRW